MIGRTVLFSSVVWAGLSIACTRAQPPAPLTDAERAALADTVRASVREYMRAAAQIPCERPDSLLDQIATFAYGPVLSATDTTIVSFTREAVLATANAPQCPSPVEDAKLVGVIEVQLLSRDHAVVAWKFDEEMREPDGRRQRVQGVVFETKVRTDAGWRTTAGMGSHVKVGTPRMLPSR